MAGSGAEPRVLDQSWRLWASVIILGAVSLGAVLGIVVLPVVQGRAAGLDAFTAICRAIGILPGSPSMPQPPSGAAPEPVTQVAWSPDLMIQLARADRKAGEEISQACVGCHGERGFAPDPQNPNLAGQSALAIYKQLHDYKSGARQNEVMTGIAQGLEDRQIIDVTAYYASLLKGDLDPTTAQVTDPVIVQLVERGDPARNLAACGSCHGDRAGGPSGTPTLSGQNRDYLAQQLRLYAKGERHNDIYHRMRSVASKLTDREIERLATYYSTTLSR